MKYFFCIFLLVKNVFSENEYSFMTSANEIESSDLFANSSNRLVTVEENDIIFRYYNRDIKNVGIRVFIGNVTDNFTRWKKCDSLKIIIHGWMSSGLSSSVVSIKDAYLSKIDINIITVDWSDPASWKLYPLPAYLTQQVGKLVADLIDQLVAEKIVASDKVHVIGHSLGAHVAGAAGSAVKIGRISRITGLDPAGPVFEHYNLVGNVLDKSDAVFVDVIHTAGGVAGYYGSIGHIDFYPNGGTPPQPGCIEPQLVSGVFNFVGCSHGRAYEYYSDSVLHPKTYLAHKCESWSSFKNGYCKDNHEEYMGDQTSFGTNGSYYLETKSEAPYGNLN